MSRQSAARELRKQQVEVVKKRLFDYNETVSQLRDVMSELGEFGAEPTTNELVIIFGTALVHSNLALAQMMAFCQAESDLVALAIHDPAGAANDAASGAAEGEATP